MGAYIQNGDKWVFSTRSDKILDADNVIFADTDEEAIAKIEEFHGIVHSDETRYFYTVGNDIRRSSVPVLTVTSKYNGIDHAKVSKIMELARQHGEIYLVSTTMYWPYTRSEHDQIVSNPGFFIHSGRYVSYNLKKAEQRKAAQKRRQAKRAINTNDLFQLYRSIEDAIWPSGTGGKFIISDISWDLRNIRARRDRCILWLVVMCEHLYGPCSYRRIEGFQEFKQMWIKLRDNKGSYEFCKDFVAWMDKEAKISKPRKMVLTPKPIGMIKMLQE